MSSWDGAAFDRWLTTEPEEFCIHVGIECELPECRCRCGECAAPYEE